MPRTTEPTQSQTPEAATGQKVGATPKKENPSISEIFNHTSTAGDGYTSEAARTINANEVTDLAEDDFECFLIGQNVAEGLSEKEHQTCRELVALLRSGFWLGSFIDNQLNYVKHGVRPTPAQLMCDLAEPQREWRDSVVEARRVNKWWPEVLTTE